MYWYCVIIALIFLILTIVFIKKRLLDITSLQLKLTRLTQEIALLKNEKENKE